MRRVVPIILVLPIALMVYLADPIRRAGPMIDPVAIAAPNGELPPAINGWVRAIESEMLPRAYPPHNLTWQPTARYVDPLTGDEAFLRVVVVQDRRDLLAFDPSEAMRAGGWAHEGSRKDERFHHTSHRKGPEPFTERVTLDTVYVAPGYLGPNREAISRIDHQGPGWPGPAALVQLLLTSDDPVAHKNLQHVAWDLARTLADRLDPDRSRGRAP
ncbi:MAG: hypothetical protein ACIAS6_11910 [Phycisphaerales bacterium JB060]